MDVKPQQNDIPTYRKYYVLYVFACIIALLAVAVVYSLLYTLYDKTKDIIVEESKLNLLTLAQTQAVRFSPDDIDKVSTTTDIGTESYARLVSDLADIKKIAPKIAFAYIMKYDGQAIYPYTQIADADSIDPYVNVDAITSNDIDINKDGVIDPYGADELTPPGLVYKDAPIEDLSQALSGPHVNKDFYTDTWGTFMSAYVPIVRKDGSLSGILALDMRDDDIIVFEKIIFKPFLVTMIAILIAILVLGMSLIYVWQKKLKQILSFDKQKNIVIGMIGHELKTPLSAVRWILSSVLEQKDIPDTVLQKVKQAYNVTVSAADMSNTILDLSRIQLGKLDLVKEQCDIKQLISSIKNEIYPIAEHKGVSLSFTVNQSHIDYSESLYVYASPQYLKIAIKNLISNAIKYTEKGGKVTVSVDSSDVDVCTIVVADTGSGIKEEYQTHMFQKFSRAKDITNIEGHGLGLYLTNNIVRLHGGKLSFVSTVGKGTEFTMELPKNIV